MAKGPPPKLDAERVDRIIESISLGNSRETAAAAGGVCVRTLLNWIARGRAGEAPFDAFAARVKKADGEAEGEMVAVVRNAALTGTWQAAAWWLERCRSKRYALKRDMKVELKRELSEDEARAKYKEITGKEWGT